MADKKKTILYFFLNGDLHKKLHIKRSADSIKAWNYPQARVMTYVYSDVRKMGQRAFSTMEVSQMINRSRRVIEEAILRGDIREPQSVYSLTGKPKRVAYKWREEDIMDLHAWLMTIHRGRPRLDGEIVPASNLPTARELRAMIRQETVLYVKQGDKFVPTWKAEV